MYGHWALGGVLFGYMVILYIKKLHINEVIIQPKKLEKEK